MNSSVSRTERYILFAALAIFIILHFYQLNSPPNGYHQWRESDTAAIILNYYQEDANFFHPRCNQRGDGSGITGGEFPTYSYSAAILYFLFGPYHFLARLLTLAGSLLTLFFFYKTIGTLSGSKTAIYATIALAFSPLFLFYSFKIMPDMWMLMFMMGAAYFFLRYLNDKQSLHLIWSVLFLILSATIKPLSLCLYIPLLIYFINHSFERKRAILTAVIYTAVTFLMVLGWYLYGRHLNSIHHSPAFEMGDIILKSPDYLTQPQFYKKLFLQWPFELWLGWAILPVFIFGMVKLKQLPNWRFYTVWIIASYLAFAVVAGHAGSHDYYTLVVLPPLAVISGWGLCQLLSRPKLKVATIMWVLLVFPIVTGSRIIHRFDHSEEFEMIRNAAEQHIPRNSLVIVEETTSAVRLYQLNRHGWAFRNDLVTDNLLPLIYAGGEYLVLRKPIDSTINELVIDSAFQVGPLYGYKTIKPD